MRLWPTRIGIYAHDIAVLRAPAPPTIRTDIVAVEHTATQSAEILRLHARIGHRLSADRLTQRFLNRLQFFAFLRGEELLGSTWAAIGVSRYLDEMNWLLPISPTEFWVRDVFTVPAHRGRGLFAAFVNVLAQQHVRSCTGVWSDVDWDNEPSMKAHRKAGFGIHARVRALDIDGRLRLRGRLLDWPMPVHDITPDRRLIRLAGDQLRRHRELLA